MRPYTGPLEEEKNGKRRRGEEIAEENHATVPGDGWMGNRPYTTVDFQVIPPRQSLSLWWISFFMRPYTGP